MICPHCRKPITWEITAETLAKAKALRKEGYSLRDISQLLSEDGFLVSFSSLSRHFRKPKEKRP